MTFEEILAKKRAELGLDPSPPEAKGAEPEPGPTVGDETDEEFAARVDEEVEAKAALSRKANAQPRVHGDASLVGQDDQPTACGASGIVGMRDEVTCERCLRVMAAYQDTYDKVLERERISQEVVEKREREEADSWKGEGFAPESDEDFAARVDGPAEKPRRRTRIEDVTVGDVWSVKGEKRVKVTDRRQVFDSKTGKTFTRFQLENQATGKAWPTLRSAQYLRSLVSRNGNGVSL